MDLDQATLTAPLAAVPPLLTNGAVVSAAPALGPQVPRDSEWLDLPAPYTGFRIRAWTDYPQGLFTGLETEADLAEALRQVLLEHNGWRDEAGPLPPPSDPAFYQRVGTRLLVTTTAVVRQAATTPPNLPALTRPR